MLAYYVKQMIKDWHNKSELEKGNNNEKGVFNQFISLRISFNAYYSGKYLGKISSDRSCVEKIASDEIESFKVWCQEKEIMDFFNLDLTIPNTKIYYEIYELLDEYENNNKSLDEFLENHDKKAKKANIGYKNLNDCNEFLLIIYQIRCNIFHGQKGFNDSENIEIVGKACSALKVFLEKLYMKEGGILD